jgi:hypothetical protein
MSKKPQMGSRQADDAKGTGMANAVMASAIAASYDD